MKPNQTELYQNTIIIATAMIKIAPKTTDNIIATY